MINPEPEPIPLSKKVTVEVIMDSPSWATCDFDVESYIRYVAQTVLNNLDYFNSDRLTEFSVKLSDDEGLRQLNNEYRNQDKTTNVLSFPNLYLKEGKAVIGTDSKISLEGRSLTLPVEDNYLGDIAISYERVSEESIEQEKKFKEHLAHLLVHSILHLLGYDHYEERDAANMEALEIVLLAKLGISDPYLDNEGLRAGSYS
jgi:probable rRNA maturation factor